MELIIKNARLRKTEGTFDIGIAKGKIAKIGKSVKGDKATVILDAEGRLATESHCNPHLHMCKVYTIDMLDPKALQAYHGGDMGSAMTAIELAARVKENYDEKWIIKNVRKCLEMAAVNGNTHIRAFADVDSKAKLEGVKALLRGRDEFKGIVDVQVVAFPQDGVVREPGTIALVDKAMKMGCDVVGGIPWIEFTDADSQTHVDEMVKLAKKYKTDVSMLVDDAGDAGLKTLEMLAVALIKNKMFGRGLIHHARAMSLYAMPYFKKISALLKQAQMGVVSDPHTGPLHARVKELLAEGNLVCFGQDDVADAYYPYGQNNMLEVAFLNSHLLWMTTFPEMETLYDMISVNGAKCMNVKNFELKEGNPANINVLDAGSVWHALWYHKAPKYVVSHGNFIAQDGKLTEFVTKRKQK